MSMRPYQQAAIDALYDWWQRHHGIDQAPILSVPPGGGKSWIIAELTRLLWDTWPDEKPRTLILVPSKELAEQNAEKLAALLPAHLHLDYYSAAIGRKRPDADVIVATIGSVYRHAHLLGNIKCVIVDECHLISPDGAGRYRQLLSDLAKLCRFRAVGLTATPFRGNGVWLTEGRDPLFTGIAYSVPMGELIDAGYLAPLVRPIDAIQTRIDTSGISTSSGDYQIDALEQRVQRYLVAAADETIKLASDRQKWLAFCPTVATAEELVGLFTARGIATVLVTGETPKKERARHVSAFRASQIRCLVTVLALATGFDVPDVDCLIWLRPTISPVLFVQGSGRGLRSAHGKTDALWIDFSDTTQRLGPIDQIKGRKKGKVPADPQAPFAICDNCGSQVRPASALECPECGAVLREPEEKTFTGASIAPILGRQQAQRVRHPVSRVTYHRHSKPEKPDSLCVSYWSGPRVVAREYLCFEHRGWAAAKAAQWWTRRHADSEVPATVTAALANPAPKTPAAIITNESGKYPEIIAFEWENNHDAH